MLYAIFVDAVGDSPASDTVFERLRTALAGEAHELDCRPSEWTGTFTVEADDVEQAAELVRLRVAARRYRSWPADLAPRLL
jgi:hypothetical protein